MRAIRRMGFIRPNIALLQHGNKVSASIGLSAAHIAAFTLILPFGDASTMPRRRSGRFRRENQKTSVLDAENGRCMKAKHECGWAGKGGFGQRLNRQAAADNKAMREKRFLARTQHCKKAAATWKQADITPLAASRPQAQCWRVRIATTLPVGLCRCAEFPA